jgi:hypothetical protein
MDITIYLSNQQRENLSQIEKNSDLDVETLLNHAINQEYEQLQLSKPNSLEILRNSGFIGCGTGDSDLSTNYKAILAKEWSF